jgi:hypothetical protein
MLTVLGGYSCMRLATAHLMRRVAATRRLEAHSEALLANGCAGSALWLAGSRGMTTCGKRGEGKRCLLLTTNYRGTGCRCVAC